MNAHLLASHAEDISLLEPADDPGITQSG